MFKQRERRNRVLEALDLAVKQFRSREDLYPLRIPHEPLLLSDIVEQALQGEARAFDEESLRARTLLALDWDDGSRWELWIASLPSGLRLYCDSGEGERRILASGGRNAGDESDLMFLELLGWSRGEIFGIEMSGGAPRRVRSPIDRALLVDFFVDLFEGTVAEDDIRRDHAVSGDGRQDGNGRDFRTEVDTWLDRAKTAARSGEAGDSLADPSS
jgi:hypothetical protein